MNYNYVIFQTHYDYYQITYSDLLKNPSVEFINTYPKYGGKISRILCKIHRSSLLDKIHFPLKKIWNPLFFHNNFIYDKPICFVFSAAIAGFEKYGLISYLRESYPNSKFVCFYQDIVDSVKNSSIEQLFPLFDLILSYDKEDVKQYGLTFHNTVFSDYKVSEDDLIPNSDVYFIGAAKNRLKDIYSIYERLVSKHIKCDFNIIGVDEKDKHCGEGLHYIDGMSYEENLKHVLRTKVVLEVIQKKATGASLRMWESINYDKFFLTNNEAAYTFDCFDHKNMHYISDIDKIEEWISLECKYSKEQKESIRPIKLLEFIDKML